jgi:hypothetical protein
MSMDEKSDSIKKNKKNHRKKIWKLENFDHFHNQEPNDKNEDKSYAD